MDKNVYIEMPCRKDFHLEEDPISMCNIDVPQSHKTSELIYFVTLKNCRRQLGLEPAFHEL